LITFRFGNYAVHDGFTGNKGFPIVETKGRLGKDTGFPTATLTVIIDIWAIAFAMIASKVMEEGSHIVA